MAKKQGAALPAEVTTSQAAGMLGMNPRRVRELFAKGLIKGRKMSDRLTMLRTASIEAYIAKHESTPSGRVRPVATAARRRRSAKARQKS
jgi:hypothetical protein